MSTLELKGSILQLLANVKDEELLQELYKTLKNHIQEQDKDWWDELNATQQLELDKAIEESYEADNLVSDKTARKTINQWLQK